MEVPSDFFRRHRYQGYIRMDMMTLAAGASHSRKRLRIGARNRLKRAITEIVESVTTSHVRIDIGGAVVTASITNEAVDKLKLTAGREAYAVVKASDVMVGVD